MSTMIDEHVLPQKWKLTALDRCDKCGTQALVKVVGVKNELLFCGHDYNKIISTSSGYANLMTFAFNVIDEREKLNER
jgi:hypothetical protein